MGAKVTVVDMTNAIVIAGRMARGHGVHDLDTKFYADSLIAARDYILTAESQIAERDAQIAEMRIVTGPKCPKCGHWLKAEHRRSFNPPRGETRYYCAHDDHDDGCQCELWTSELIASHPLIAAELGLTEASDA